MVEQVELLRSLADAAEQAVRALSLPERQESAGIGADGLPARRVDREAEQAILGRLDGHDVDYRVCSEELGLRSGSDEYTLVVDPVDGTRNAANGIPFYCVSLALTPGGIGDVEVGLVRNLPTGDEFVAVEGQGAKLNGEPITTRPFDPEQAIRSPRAHGQAPALGPRVDEAQNVRELGAAALEVCLVAQGAMDAYIHPEEGLRVVDVAAAQLILREAGGAAARANGRELDIALDPQDRTDMIAVGDPSLFADREVPS
jgi:fructose-1,6-bisphosphatase/inositol monophosphatase family enzyme